MEILRIKDLNNSHMVNYSTVRQPKRTLFLHADEHVKEDDTSLDVFGLNEPAITVKQ